MSNKSLKKLLVEMQSLDEKILNIQGQINSILAEKLGDEWGITQQTDGLCLVNEGDNYVIPNFDFLIDALKLSKDEAISRFEKNSI